MYYVTSRFRLLFDIDRQQHRPARIQILGKPHQVLARASDNSARAKFPQLPLGHWFLPGQATIDWPQTYSQQVCREAVFCVSSPLRPPGAALSVVNSSSVYLPDSPAPTSNSTGGSGGGCTSTFLPGSIRGFESKPSGECRALLSSWIPPVQHPISHPGPALFITLKLANETAEITWGYSSTPKAPSSSICHQLSLLRVTSPVAAGHVVWTATPRIQSSPRRIRRNPAKQIILRL